MAEEARDETKTVPRAIKFVVLAVFAIYAALPMVALSALPVHKGRRRQVHDAARHRRGQGRLRRRTPCWGSASTCISAGCSRSARSSRPARRERSCSSPPNAGIIGASRLVYSMGPAPRGPQIAISRHAPRFSTPWIGIPLLFGGVACLTIIPGRPNSSATCTPSGQCSRSRSPTCR